MDTYCYGKPEWTSVEEQEALRAPMGQALDLARKMNLAAMAPHPELASTTYCLANPGSEHLIYQPRSGEAFSAERGTADDSCEGFDPTHGTLSTGGKIAARGGVQQFKAPFVEIHDLEIRGYGSAGVRIEHSPNVVVRGCKIWNDFWHGWPTGRAISINFSPGFTDERDVLFRPESGFWLYQSPRARLVHNPGRANLYGAAHFSYSVPGSVCRNNDFAFQGNDVLVIEMHPLKQLTAWLAAALALTVVAPAADLLDTPLFTVHEVALRATGHYANPYRELEADVVLTPPDGGTNRFAPLFWDGDSTWRFRFSPDRIGEWRWTVRSRDSGLDGQTGRFLGVASGRPGSIRPMPGFPGHFERQNGSRFWFMGDTAWALYLDNEQEAHDRGAAERYLEARATQGFNVVHSALLSEAGWDNRGGPAFAGLAQEEINPRYWQEVDHRLTYANRLGLVCGLALAWGDKSDEPYAWRKFPSVEARRRYSRYIAARFAAYDIYFIVSGEWHAEIATRGSTEDAVRKEFIALGAVLRASDPHQRMIAIHPMNENGSVREFNKAPWMSFGDYQQNYVDLHGRVLQSLPCNKPVVNSEYGYYLRDQNGDGTPDKENGTTLEIIRHATWDIVMAGGYVVTGFGTTYFGGNRDPGRFDVEAERNRAWEVQMGYLKHLFTGLEWWTLEPHDELLHSGMPRGRDRSHLGRIAPPETTYWCLSKPGRVYLLYVRGLSEPIELTLAAPGAGLKARQWNPRTGEFTPLGLIADAGRFSYLPPDPQDWVVVLD